MITPPVSWSTRNIIFGTLLLAAIAACLVFLIRYAQVVFIIFLALTLSIAVEPLVAWVQGRGNRRLDSAIVVYGGLLLSLVLLLLMIVPLIYSQVNTIGSLLPEYYDSLRNFLLSSPASLVRALGAQLPPQLQDLLATIVVGDGSPLYVITQIGGQLFDALLVFLLAFYWTLDRERAVRFFIIRLPEVQRDQVREAITTFEDKVGAFIRGQTLLCIVVGAMAFIAYMIIRLPYAFSLGVIAGVLEAVPMIGPVLGAIPAVLLAMAIAPNKLFWVIIATIVIQQLENNLLVPRVMDRSVGVNAVVSILAIAAFSLLFGIPGAILAIPLAAVIQVALDRFIFSNPALLPTADNNPLTTPITTASGAAGAGAPAPVTTTQVTLPTSNGIKTVVTRVTSGSSSAAEQPLPVTGSSPAPKGAAEDGPPAVGLTDEALNPNAELQDMLIPAARDQLSVLHMEIHELTQDIRKRQREKGVLADPVSDDIEDGLEALAEQLYEVVARHTHVQTGAE